MKQPSHLIDRIFMRTKDVLLITAALWAAFVTIIGWLSMALSLPEKVEAHEISITEIRQLNADHAMKIQSVEKDIDYIVRSINEVKATQRAILKEVVKP